MTTTTWKNNWFYKQNNSSARASRFLVHTLYFFDVHYATTVYGVKLPDAFMEDVNTRRRIFLFWIWIQPLIRIQLQEKKKCSYLTNWEGLNRLMFLLPSSSLRKLRNNLGLNHITRSKHFSANANYFLLILIIYASAMKPRGNTFYKLLKPPTLEPVCYTTAFLILKKHI